MLLYKYSFVIFILFFAPLNKQTCCFRTTSKCRYGTEAQDEQMRRVTRKTMPRNQHAIDAENFKEEWGKTIDQYVILLVRPHTWQNHFVLHVLGNAIHASTAVVLNGTLHNTNEGSGALADITLAWVRKNHFEPVFPVRSLGKKGEEEGEGKGDGKGGEKRKGKGKEGTKEREGKREKGKSGRSEGSTEIVWSSRSEKKPGAVPSEKPQRWEFPRRRHIWWIPVAQWGERRRIEEDGLSIERRRYTNSASLTKVEDW